MRRPVIWLVLCATTAAGGCQFVQVSDKGANVKQATSADVVNCRNVGQVVATTQARVLIKRGDVKVRQELIDLARNQAAELGANAIVPVAPHENGKQTFRAYACD